MQFAKASLLIASTFSGIKIAFNFSQFAKALLFIDSKELDNAIADKEEQRAKELAPIWLTVDGNTTVLREIQEKKAKSSMILRLLEKMMLDKEEHLKNAFFSIFSIFSILGGKIISGRAKHSEKVPKGILVTAEGTLIEVREIQPKNALRPKFHTLSGSVTDFKFSQFAKAFVPKLATP